MIRNYPALVWFFVLKGHTGFYGCSNEKIFLNKKTAAIKIPGYRIYLQEFTQLEHWAVSQLVEKQPFEKISQLVKFYIDEKITPNAYQFKRYRETP